MTTDDLKTVTLPKSRAQDYSHAKNDHQATLLGSPVKISPSQGKVASAAMGSPPGSPMGHPSLGQGAPTEARW
jgi:hypothetical protein